MSVSAQEKGPILKKVSSQEIDPKSAGVRVIFCIRNEKFRLPFFLEYYRKLGVTDFFAVDNNSSDSTQSYLLQQPDVHVFFTDESYKESNAGRDWTSELANLYCNNQWCLTLDVDEFLVYPFIEHVSLPLLTDYLDQWGYQGLFSIFLDLYSDKALSETTYQEGTSPFDLCNYFDTADSYSVFETSNFPYLQIKGGARQRKFWDPLDSRSGPAMRKLVLIKWNDDFEYLHSTHSCTSIRLADITSAVAHFKFLAHLKDYARSEVERNDRVANSGDWKVYAEALSKEDVQFMDDDISIFYTGSQSLMDDGHISSSLRYFDYVFSERFRSSVGAQLVTEAEKVNTRTKLQNKNEKSSISYRKLNDIWPGIGLFSQTYGANSKGAQDLFRIDEDINNLVHSRYWRATYKIRKMAAKFGFCDQRSFPEDMRNQTTYSRFTYTYRSVWWELSAPIRLVVRIIKKIFK